MTQKLQERYKFRGMTVGGEWVYGLLSIKGDDWFISNKAGAPHAYQVRPETLGQYTGLKDKWGEEIFEGDIVQSSYTWESYEPDGEGFETRFSILQGPVIFTERGWRVKNEITPLFEWDKKSLEIIGNLYESTKSEVK